MSSSILRLICEKEAAGAAASFLRRRISLSHNRGFSKLCGGGGGDSSLRRVSSPWLMIPPPFGGGAAPSYNMYNLAQNKVVSLKKKSKQESESESPDDDALFVGTSHGWLALCNQHGERGLFLSNPVTGENIKLPPLNTLGIGAAVRRVILSSPPHQQDCRAMLTFVEGQLAVCSPGQSSEWTTPDNRSRGKPLDDVVYSTAESDRLFLCLFDEDLELWDATDPSAPYNLRCESIHSFMDVAVGLCPAFRRTEQHCSLSIFQRYFPVQHLVHVEHTDQLLLVNRYFVTRRKRLEKDVFTYRTIDFDVHVIDLHRGKLCYMEDSLDGLVLFLGLHHSFAVPAAECPELKPDSIYFTEIEAYNSATVFSDEHMYGGHDMGIFNYKEKTISPCYYPCDRGGLKKIYPSPFWFTPTPY